MTPRSDAIVLIGPMGAGKTSIGRKAAKRLGVAFTDTDAVIARAHGPIPRIFAERGEETFRMLERDAVRESLSEAGVVSLGGGAVLHPDTRAQLRSHRVALLTVRADVVAGRLADTTRPLLAGGDASIDPLERWTRIYAERRPLYDDLADVVFDTSSGPISAIVDDLVAWAASGKDTA